MARRPKKAPKQAEWLASYADMMTLLLCFFVLLFSFSSVSEANWKIVIEGFNPNATVLVPVPVSPDNPLDYVDPSDWPDQPIDLVNAYYTIYQALDQLIKDGDFGDSISMNASVDGLLFITFENDIMFDGDSARVRPEALYILDLLADAMSDMNEHIGEIRVLGHTNRIQENRPNNVAADRTLASDRSTNVLIHLQESGKIEGKKLRSYGLGEWYPVAPHYPESNARKNRRVEILIMQDELVSKTLEEIYEEVGRNILSYD
ncbi:MAG: OmpA family protein [Oscillospiraceae bacterium]|nr:OmpA family protein [Oscillospiraceae bacterium]